MKSNNFKKLYEELVKGEEGVNLIGVCTPSHPGSPFLHFFKIPDNEVTGTVKDWEAARAAYDKQSLPRGTEEMVYLLDVPRELATKLLLDDFDPDTIRKEITPYSWGKIGRLRTPVAKSIFIPGPAVNGPIRRGKHYLE